MNVYDGVRTTMNANRRLQERKLPERIVLCKLGGEESSFVLNLSEDGLGFESHTPIEKTGVLQLRLSAEMDGTIETAGRLAWLDPEKRIGGLRFLELSASAREKIRAWLSETSTLSSETNDGALLTKPDELALEYPLTYKSAPDRPTTYKPVLWQQAAVPGVQLVPIERHRVQKRRHFLGGVFVGFGTCALLVIAISWFAGGMKLSSLPWATASAGSTAQPIAQQNHPSVVLPASPSAPLSKPEQMQMLTSAAPARSPQNQWYAQSQKQSPPAAGASSTNLMTRTSAHSATPPAKPGERVATSLLSAKPNTNEPPLRANRAAEGPAPAASNTHSSSFPLDGQMNGQVGRQAQHPKKSPPTLEQLWSALQKGNVKAAVALADLYARGEDVPQNCQQARVLLQVASEKHNAEASKKLQELDKGGCPANTPTE